MQLGRQPVQIFKIETLYNLFDNRLFDFRKKIFTEDLNLSSNTMHINKNHKWWIDTFGQKYGEDAYKYSDVKWNTVKFDNIEAIIENNNIVGISGCKKYNNYLRTSMHLYLLKSVRSKYPGIKYLPGGWFERHINYAIENNLDGLFFSVYAYSKKLQGLINNHKGKTISLINKKHLKYIQDIQYVGEFMFYNVKQSFFYYPLNNAKFEISNVTE